MSQKESLIILEYDDKFLMVVVKIVYFISFRSRFLFTFFLSQCSLRLVVLRNLGHAVLAKVQSASCVE